MFHVKHGLLSVAVSVLACTNPSDTIHVPDPFTPEQVAPGIYRLTRNLGADYPRMTLDGGRLLYLAHDLPGFPDGWGLYSLDPQNQDVREEFSGYRASLRTDRLGGVGAHAAGRVLIGEVEPLVNFQWCVELKVNPPRAAPRPTMRFLRLLDLGLADRLPISAVQRPILEPDIFEFANGFFGPLVRVRLLPSMSDADSLGTNPWGPAVHAAGTSAYVSDGESILRVPLGGSEPWAPVLVAAGAYPALAPDGSRLLYARATVTDSVLQVDVIHLFAGGRCTQTTVLYTISEWNTFSLDLVDGTEQLVTSGAEPVFLDAATILVRRPDGIYQVELATGATTRIVAIPHAASAVPLADGSVAFSADLFGGRDIFLIRP
jgi:hypothetical protein